MGNFFLPREPTQPSAALALTKLALSVRELERAEKQVATPTEAQKETGNYAKGHVVFQGLPITIETAKGQWRRGVGKDGKPWAIRLSASYGYFKRTVSEADGDHIDVFLSDTDLRSPVAFVVNQIDPTTGRFDEHKTILGEVDAEAAKRLYHANYSAGWKGFQSLVMLTLPQLKWWMENGDTSKPLKEDFYVKKAQDLALCLPLDSLEDAVEKAAEWGEGHSPEAQAAMRGMGHGRLLCSCGAVIRSCRCMRRPGDDTHKEITVTKGCRDCYQGKQAAEDERPFTVAVDLDGTLAEQEEPFTSESIGAPRPHARRLLRLLRRRKARVIIFTVRGSKKLVADWFAEHDLPYDYINENPDQPADASGKVLADVYLDDRALNAVDLVRAIRSLEKRLAA